MKRTKIFQ